MKLYTSTFKYYCIAYAMGAGFIVGTQLKAMDIKAVDSGELVTTVLNLPAGYVVDDAMLNRIYGEDARRPAEIAEIHKFIAKVVELEDIKKSLDKKNPHWYKVFGLKPIIAQKEEGYLTETDPVKQKEYLRAFFEDIYGKKIFDENGGIYAFPGSIGTDSIPSVSLDVREMVNALFPTLSGEKKEQFLRLFLKIPYAMKYLSSRRQYGEITQYYPGVYKIFQELQAITPDWYKIKDFFKEKVEAKKTSKNN